MTLTELPKAVADHRDQNCADFELIQSGLDSGSVAPDPHDDDVPRILLIERMITHSARCGLTGDIGGRRDVLRRIAQLLTPSLELELRPLMRWGFEFTRALEAFDRSEYERSRIHAQRSEFLASHTQTEDAIASSLNILGRLAHRVEAFDRAIDLLTRSIAGPGSPRTVATSHVQLATVFESQHEIDLALSHRRIALEVLPETGIADRGRFEVCLAQSLIRLGRLGEARDNLDLIDTGRPDVAAMVALARAELGLAEGDLSNTFAQAEWAGTKFRELGLVGRTRSATSMQAEVRIAQARHSDAISLLISDLGVSDTTEHEKACRQLIVCHKALKNWAEVVRYQELLRQHMERRQLDLHSFHQLQEQSYHLEDLREKNRALDERNQEFEMLRTDRKILLNIVAHELRSPLTALGLVLHSIDERRHEGADIADRVRTGSQLVRRMHGIADQVATVGELTSGQFELELSAVFVDRAIQSVLDEQVLSASRKGILLTVTGQGIEAIAHQGRLEQVLSNLVSNAIKFSSSGSQVDLVVEQCGASVMVRVVDQGPGLTDVDLDRVFRRHAKLSARPTGGEPSSGMGLFIAKQLALAMGGDLLASSGGPAKGATFALELQGVPVSASPSSGEVAS